MPLGFPNTPRSSLTHLGIEGTGGGHHQTYDQGDLHSRNRGMKVRRRHGRRSLLASASRGLVLLAKYRPRECLYHGPQASSRGGQPPGLVPPHVCTGGPGPYFALMQPERYLNGKTRRPAEHCTLVGEGGFVDWCGKASEHVVGRREALGGVGGG